MASRPQPLILPTQQAPQDPLGGNIGQLLGAILGQRITGSREQEQEQQAQQQFQESLGSIFSQPVPAEGPVLPGGEAPVADVVPGREQGIIQLLSQTAGGRQLGQQQGAAALKDLLTPQEATLSPFEIAKQKAEGKLAGEGVEGEVISEVQSSSMLPSGLVQIVRKDGTTELVQANEADKLLIEQAERRKQALSGLGASEREGAKNAQKTSLSSFKQLAGVRKGIATIDEAIKSLDEGAKSGVVESKFPTIREASLKLKNAQAQMGLNVIQNTTFGSLSEAELAFALSTAVPLGLDETALRSWLVEKRAAQQKLSAYIEEAAIFLGSTREGEGGKVIVNKIPDFLKLKRESQQQPTPPAGGGIEFLGFE